MTLQGIGLGAILVAAIALLGYVIGRRLRLKPPLLSEEKIAEIHRAAEKERARALAELDARVAELEAIKKIPDKHERMRRLAQYAYRTRR